MSERIQERPAQRGETYVAEEVDADFEAAQQAAQANMDGLDTDVDAMLWEIDEILEENAEQFVNNFQQRGGQ